MILKLEHFTFIGDKISKTIATIVSLIELFLYQSIPSLTIPPPRRSTGIRTFSFPGGRVFAQLSLPGGSRFWIREIFYSFERKMQELLDLLGMQLEKQKQVFLCCFISIFAITVDDYLTFRRNESIICSYLLHGCDVIRIFKLCIEERGVSVLEYNIY